jgi:hypothetical protein
MPRPMRLCPHLSPPPRPTKRTLVIVRRSDGDQAQRRRDAHSNRLSDVEIGPLQEQFVTSAIDPLFKEMIANTRIVGGFLRRKVKMYNAGAVLFVVSVTLYALGF